MTDSPQPAAENASAPAADPARKAINWVVLLIILSLVWYLMADRYTPYTQQARVQAFIVPVAAEVSGRVTKVHVRNNQDVKAGELLFEVNPEQYQIADERTRADLTSNHNARGANLTQISDE